MNAIALLELGALGFGGLIFLLTFRLINAHQETLAAAAAGGRTADADGARELLKTIRIYLYVGLVAYLAAAAIEVTGWIIDPERRLSYTVSPELTALGYPDLDVRRVDTGQQLEHDTSYWIDDDIPLRIGADGIMVKAGNYRMAAAAAVTEASRMAQATATLARTITESEIGRDQAGSSAQPVQEALGQSSEALRNLRSITAAIQATPAEGGGE